MHSLQILRAGEELAIIYPDASSTQVKKVMSDNRLALSFDDSRWLPFKIGDYCTAFGEVYRINKLPTVTKSSSLSFQYSLTMEAEGFDLSKVQYLFLGDDNSLKETDFSLMQNAAGFLSLLMQNLDRVGAGFTLGQVIETGQQLMTFSASNCYNALADIAAKFNTEFWLEGRTIHLTKRSTDTGHTFQVGRQKGQYDLTRQNVDDSSVITRLYAYGSEKNIPSEYRNYSKRLKMPAIDYVEQGIGEYGIIEGVKIFDEIYPHRTGKVTSVDATDVMKVTDSNIDFNVNDYFLGGYEAKLTFNTGQLAGYEFKLERFDWGQKEFKLLPIKEGDLTYPNTTLKAAIGDEYVLTDIKMPQSYIDAAEAELKAAAESLLAQISQPQVSYSCTFDPVYLKTRRMTLNIGDIVWIRDAQFMIDRRIRITSITRNIQSEYSYQVEMSDVITAGKIDRIISAQADTARGVQNLSSTIQNSAIFNDRLILSETSNTTGMQPVYIDGNGKLYRKV